MKYIEYRDLYISALLIRSHNLRVRLRNLTLETFSDGFFNFYFPSHFICSFYHFISLSSSEELLDVDILAYPLELIAESSTLCFASAAALHL